MLRILHTYLLVLAVTLGVGCDDRKDTQAPDPMGGIAPQGTSTSKESSSDRVQGADERTPSQTSGEDAGPDTVADSEPEKKPAAATESSHPRAGLDEIPANCIEPYAVLRSIASDRHGDSFSWRWAEQFFLANPQFELVSGEPAPGQVSLFTAPSRNGGVVGLIARCHAAETCMKLALAYRELAHWSTPKTACGKASLPYANLTPIQLSPDKRLTDLLPDPSNLVSSCIRLAACRYREGTDTAGDPARDCWKRPSDFKIKCASRFPCSAVLACESSTM